MRSGIAGLGILAVLSCGAARAADFPAPLPVETVGRVLSLPATYPESWIFTNSYAKIEVLDTLPAGADPVRGQLASAAFSNLAVASTRPDVYVAETFYSRGTRGVRTDVVTDFDTATLAPKGEIVLTGSHRYLSGPQPNAFQLSRDEAFGFVFAFTPAASVKVLDLAGLKTLNEVPIPGCALIYPTGARGFSTLCGSGTMVSVQLDGAGRVVGQAETRAFNDLSDDPLFSLPARDGTISYFTSFKGSVQPIDLAGPSARLLPRWSLVTAEEAKANWRPSGWQQAYASGGRLYVIMQPNGHEGTHKDGGPEVWVFDLASHAKVATVKLKTPARSVAVTEGAHPVLVTAGANPDMPLIGVLEAYDLKTFSLMGSTIQAGLDTAPVIFPVRR